MKTNTFHPRNLVNVLKHFGFKAEELLCEHATGSDYILLGAVGVEVGDPDTTKHTVRQVVKIVSTFYDHSLPECAGSVSVVTSRIDNDEIQVGPLRTYGDVTQMELVFIRHIRHTL